MTVSYQLPLKASNPSKTFLRENSHLANLSKTNSHLEIDRLFICTDRGEKAISMLRQLGLYCPSTVVQSKSQGTRSQIFFFQNIYIAIIWLGDEDRQLDTAIDFKKRVNWRESLASPFGVGLSKKSNMSESAKSELPVDDWVVNNHIAYSQQNQKSSLEPLFFTLPDRLKYSNILNQNLPQNQRYINHPLEVRNITNIRIAVQRGKRRDSNIISWARYSQLLEIERAAKPLLAFTFDDGVQGKIFDARPVLPVIFRY